MLTSSLSRVEALKTCFFDTNAYSGVFITRTSSKIAIGKKALNLTVTLGFLKPHVGAIASAGIRKCPQTSNGLAERYSYQYVGL